VERQRRRGREEVGASSLQAETFVDILAAVVAGRLICLNSDILRLEVRCNPSTAERERIEDFLTLCAEAVAESAEVLHIAQALR
jgi:hypothetical protein